MMIASTSRSYLVVEKIAMGDGRYDSARLAKAIEEHAQTHLLVDMEALAQQSGAMINAVMLGADRRLRAAADPAGRVRGRDPRRRQGGRDAISRASAPASMRRGRPAHRRTAADRRRSARRSLAGPPRSRARDRRHAGGRARRRSPKASAGSPPTRTLAYARLYLDRLGADPRGRRARQRGRPPAARDRAASGAAHVLRGRDPRRRGQDRSGAHGRGSRPRSAPSRASRSR